MEFDDHRPTDRLTQALRELGEAGAVRLLDLVIVRHDTTGHPDIAGLNEAAGFNPFNDFQLQTLGMASDDDLTGPCARTWHIRRGCFSEMLCAKNLAAKLADAGDFVVHAERTPANIVNAALSAEEQE